MSEMVTVKADNGEEVQVSRAFAESKELEVIEQPDPEAPTGETVAEDRTLVRVKLKDGGEASVSRAFAKSRKLTVLKDKSAVDAFGVARDAKPHIDLSGVRGRALDDALEAAGLDKSGTADEKRARLAEHQASGTSVPAGNTDNGGVSS
jgi:hypothetical protein